MNIQVLSSITENVSWIFDGIGTELICSIISLCVGGLLGYRIGVKNRIKQKQKAGDNAFQQQIGSVNTNNGK